MLGAKERCRCEHQCRASCQCLAYALSIAAATAVAFLRCSVSTAVPAAAASNCNPPDSAEDSQKPGACSNCFARYSEPPKVSIGTKIDSDSTHARLPKRQFQTHASTHPPKKSLCRADRHTSRFWLPTPRLLALPLPLPAVRHGGSIAAFCNQVKNDTRHIFYMCKCSGRKVYFFRSAEGLKM